MLNALRHHGGGHTLVRIGKSLGCRCSTPYGITAEVTVVAIK